MVTPPTHPPAKAMHSMRRPFLVPALAAAGLLAAVISLPGSPTAEAPPANGYAPKVAPASNEGQLAAKRIRVPDGLRVELFAAEPMLANPVCFCVDVKNRFYVADAF